MQGYTESDFMYDIDDRKSISDSIFLCNGGAIVEKIQAAYHNRFHHESRVHRHIGSCQGRILIHKFVTELGVCHQISFSSTATTMVP